jgi:predicted hydrocarbon binding protein
MEIKITNLTKGLISQMSQKDEEDSAVLLEKYGREHAISEGLPNIAADIRENAQHKENHHILFTQFKNRVFGDSQDIRRYGKKIDWTITTDLFATASENGIDENRLFNFVQGYAKEIFETLFDSIVEVQLSPQTAQSKITLSITPFDDSKQWLNTILFELGKLDKDHAVPMLEQCGRACGQSHGLPHLSKEIRDKVEDKNDMDKLFALYKQEVYENSPRLYKEFGTIYLEYHACGCPIVKEKAIDNPIFCNCTVGYTKERFETLFNRPVHVELLESIIRGDKRCKQAISIIDAD